MTAPSTQQRYPWRAATRTAVQGLLTLAVLAPVVLLTVGIDPVVVPWAAGLLAGLAGFARVMALPGVVAFIAQYLPWLAAQPQQPEPDPGRHAAP